MASKPTPLTAADRERIASGIHTFKESARSVSGTAAGEYRIETTLDGQDWSGTAHDLTIKFATPSGRTDDLRCIIGLNVWSNQILCPVDLPVGEKYVPGLRNAGGTLGAFSPVADDDDVQFVVAEFLSAFPGLQVRDQRPIHD